jgi:hypothetical protein
MDDNAFEFLDLRGIYVVEAPAPTARVGSLVSK